jgi:glycosyltransferase involved in cell wall biosynthesis
MRNAPSKVSVILPVYNGECYLEEAISSVLLQTFRDFELIIIDDGSRDSSAAIIKKLDDPRIRFFQQPNKGLSATLNRAIGLARGEYIARQDQDDVCLPSRFEKQLAFLEANQDVGMVGTGAEIWVNNKRSNRFLQHPTDNASLKFGLLFDNYFVHSSMMIRRSVFENVGGYAEDDTRQPPEDYELWSRVMKKYKLANLPEVLMVYREVAGSMSRTGVNPFLPNLVKISAENIAWASGLPADTFEVVALSKLSQGVYEGLPEDLSFAKMKAVLELAASNIAKDGGINDTQLDRDRLRRVRKLRYHYLDSQSGGLIGRVFNSTTGLYLKNVARRVLQSR